MPAKPLEVSGNIKSIIPLWDTRRLKPHQHLLYILDINSWHQSALPWPRVISRISILLCGRIKVKTGLYIATAVKA